MGEQVISVVTQFVGEAVIALIGLVCAYLVFYLKQASAHIQEKTKQVMDARQQQILWDALTQVNDVAGKTVQKLEQTVAGGLREAIKDGKAQREELVALGEQAYKEVMNTVSPEVKQILFDRMGDLQNYVRSMIEAKVLQVKKQSGQSV